MVLLYFLIHLKHTYLIQKKLFFEKNFYKQLSESWTFVIVLIIQIFIYSHHFKNMSSTSTRSIGGTTEGPKGDGPVAAPVYKKNPILHGIAEINNDFYDPVQIVETESTKKS